MKLNLATVGALFRAEMRMVLRDRRSLITSVVLPVLIMPLLLFGANRVTRTQERKLESSVHHYVVTGSQAETVRQLIATTRERLHHAPAEKDAATFDFQELPGEPAAAALASGRIRFYIDAMTVDEARALPPDEPASETDSSDENAEVEEEPENWRETLVPGAPVLRFVFRGDRDASPRAMQRLTAALRETRRLERANLLQTRGFPVAPKDLAAVTPHNIATQGQTAGLMLGRGITVFVLLFILSGSAVVATDSIAGEKERGTLETLLTTAASRLEIITAKHLAILAVAVGITLIQATNLLVYVGLEIIPVPTGLAAAITPGVAALLLALFLPMAALASSLLLLTSGYAKSYKEAQLYFLPVFFLALIPALAPFLPGLPARSAIALVPVANIAVVARDVLVGSFDWPMIILSWLVTAAAAVGISRLSVRLLSTEKLITASDTDSVDAAGGAALFARQVPRWFAVMWALLLIVSNYTGTADPRVQAVINIVGLFFGASVLMLWRYRLPVRATLALRAPRPLVWLAILIAVPSGMLAGVGIMHAANLIFPMPPRLLEEFGRAIVADHIPVWQLLIFFALLPGIFEEITFRGLLLHGLHRRLRPVTLVLVVGLVFGIFHVALFRIIPTAFLGVLFTAATLLTGSIYPTIVWHALHNGLSLLLARSEIQPGELGPLYYWAGAVGLVVAFAILWQQRTPYPDLRRRVRTSPA